MTNRRALDQCRRAVDDSRARPTVVDEPLDDSIFTVWPSICRQLPPRSTILDMLWSTQRRQSGPTWCNRSRSTTAPGLPINSSIK